MKSRIIKGIALSLAVAFVATSCSKDDDPISVTGIQVEQSQALVRVGATTQLQASITPVDASVKTIEWMSRNANRATVDANGLVTGVSTGKVWIVATASATALKDSCEVTVAAPQATETLSGNITASRTLSAGKTYILDGWVYVKDGATLTIEPGTIIKGKSATKASLIIERGAKLIAEGTKDKPIIFTSDKDPGQRATGDWGGIILCGKATINVAGGEGIIEGGVGSTYGGGTSPNDNDNSGILRYIRIEYAGYAFEKDKEINGLTFGGVGKGTVVENIQVSFANDDSYEWFGGTVNVKNIVALGGLDDDFDTDFGFNGFVQFALSLRNPDVADAASKSNGFESDNDGSGTTNSPKTNPRFANVSIYGPKAVTTGTINQYYQSAMHIRRNSDLQAYNSVFAGWPTGVKIDDSKGAAGSNAALKGCIIAGMDNNYATDAANTWFNTSGWSNRVATIADLKVTSFSITNPNFLPQTGSALLTGSVTVPTGLEQTDYIGAFKNSDWTAGWAEWNPQAAIY